MSTGKLTTCPLNATRSIRTFNTFPAGNKQKVVFGKWVGRDCDILILDCPTRGVDIGVKAAMYQLMEDMQSQGKAIIMISEELTELIGMSDRLIILKEWVILQENFQEVPNFQSTI